MNPLPPGEGPVFNPLPPGEGPVFNPLPPGEGPVFNPLPPGEAPVFNPLPPGEGPVFNPLPPGEGPVFNPLPPGEGRVRVFPASPTLAEVTPSPRPSPEGRGGRGAAGAAGSYAIAFLRLASSLSRNAVVVSQGCSGLIRMARSLVIEPASTVSTQTF